MKTGISILPLLTLMLLSSCASNHHLVFFTNTTLGVEIGSEPASGSPVKFIVGYKRQEGVIDPLIPDYKFIENSTTGVDVASQKALTEPTNGDTSVVMTPQGTAIPSGKNQAHSVIAKMNFGATGGGDTETTGAQFFATGKAAEILAQNEGITAALAGDSKIITKQKVNLGSGDLLTASTLNSIYDLLNKHSKSTSPTAGEALALKLKLDSLDSGMFKTGFTHYSLATPPADFNIRPYPVQPGKSNFADLVTYLVNMESSLKTAQSLVLNNNATKNGTALTAQERQDMVKNIASYPSRIEKARETLSKNEDVVKTINFVTNKILLSSTSD